MAEESKAAVVAAGLANLAIAVTKFVAAAFTGSAAMLAEGVHSSVDTGNELLMLVGMRRARRPPDREHPFGHAHELYFWTLLVAVIIFGVGGGVSCYEGVLHLLHPPALQPPGWAYGTLAASALFEGISWAVAYRGVRRAFGSRGLWLVFKDTKDPTLITVLVEDSAALLGLLLAFGGVFLSHRLHQPRLDGAASILIGLLLATVAVLLARESRSLLVGEAASRPVVERLRALLADDPAVARVGQVTTVHLGPEQVVVNAELALRPGLDSAEVARAARRLETRARAEVRSVQRLFLDLSTLAPA